MATTSGGQSRLSWRTVLIASAGSVAAAFVVSTLWAPGTVIGAAVTPVIVALVSELLRKPVAAMPSPSAAIAPLLPAPRPGAPAGPPPETQERPAVGAGGARDVEDAGAGAAETDEAAATRRAPPVPAAPAANDAVVHEYARSDYRTLNRGRIRVVLGTAGLAFAIAVAFFLVADLTTGSSVTGSGGSSSLFSPTKHRDAAPATTTTTTEQRTTTAPVTTTPGSGGGATTEQTPEHRPATTAPERTTPDQTVPAPAPSDRSAPGATAPP